MLQAMAALQVGLYLPDQSVAEIQRHIKLLANAASSRLHAALTFLLCKTAYQQFMNARVLDAGLATLSGGTVTVSSTSAAATNPILLTYYSLDGNAATITYGYVVAGVSFDISSSNGADTNMVSWAILKP
jgi:hypothetical protein